MPKALFTIILVVKFSLCYSQAEQARVRGAVNIRTSEQKAYVNLYYTIYKADSTTNEFNFLLAKDARIRTLRSDNLKEFVFDTTLSLPRLSIRPAQPVEKKEAFEFFIDYEIGLDSANIQRYGFVELGLDWLWFPIHPALSGWNLTYDVLVEVDDPQYQLFGNGIVERVSANSFTMSAIQPDFDIDLFLMRSPKVYSDATGVVRVIGSEQNSLLKDSIVELTAKYLNEYKIIYGPKVKQVTAIIRPILNDPNGFGYARKGYFVLSEPNRLSQLDFYIAHELAHFWWLNGEAKTNGWITESFAEFNAMLLTRKLYGREAYDRIVKDKENRIERLKKDGRELPVVYGSGSANKGMFTQVAFYQKGPLLLHELELQIGEQKMEQLLRKAADKKVHTTEDFISLLKKHTNSVVSEKFLQRLKTF